MNAARTTGLRALCRMRMLALSKARFYSTETSIYEHILTSMPKPGVGMSATVLHSRPQRNDAH